MTARITSGQRDQITELVRARAGKVVDACGLDSDQAQRVIENGDEFGQIVGDAVCSTLARLSVSLEFASEAVVSSYVYPPEYTGPAPIGEQIDRLVALFGLSLGKTMRFVEQALPTLTLPDGAEGWFAIPSVEALAARFFPEVKDPAEQYSRAVNLILQKIGESRRLYNYRDGQLTKERLRQHARTVAMLARIAEVQTGDILIIPAQFGLRHRGKSVRRGRAVYTKTEFGLGSLAVGSMTITHPTRFVRWEQLHTDCAGDEYATGADGEFVSAPIFRFRDDELKFDCHGVDSARGYYGSASAFLPQ